VDHFFHGVPEHEIGLSGGGWIPADGNGPANDFPKESVLSDHSPVFRARLLPGGLIRWSAIANNRCGWAVPISAVVPVDSRGRCRTGKMARFQQGTGQSGDQSLFGLVTPTSIRWCRPDL
jgi:hypothetical protein